MVSLDWIDLGAVTAAGLIETISIASEMAMPPALSTSCSSGAAFLTHTTPHTGDL
jgi:hypothetical protein